MVWPKCTQQVQGSAGVISYIVSTPNAIGCPLNRPFRNPDGPLWLSTPASILMALPKLCTTIGAGSEAGTSAMRPQQNARQPCGRCRYGEYGLAVPQNLGLAAVQNSAGNFGRPDQVGLRAGSSLLRACMQAPCMPGWLASLRMHALLCAENRVRPEQVFLQNITEVFGSDLAIPDSLDSAGWANVSLATSACPIWPF